MGYLDNSTITVDAILTKQGRKRLAAGRTLDIKWFSLTDTGVDYTLWNPDHPSGSAQYGEAIENLPQLEAIPSAEYFMRNKLVTLDVDTTAMPIITEVKNHNFETSQTPFAYEPVLLNHTEPQGFHLLNPDSTLLTITSDGGTVGDMTGVALQFINAQEMPQAEMYAGGRFTITPKTSDRARKVTLTFISQTTGAWASVVVSFDKNTDPAVVTNEPRG